MQILRMRPLALSVAYELSRAPNDRNSVPSMGTQAVHAFGEAADVPVYSPKGKLQTPAQPPAGYQPIRERV